MVFWWVPYLPKGCRPDFNNGLGDDSNSAPFWPRRLFESHSDNGPSPGHSNLVSDEEYICSIKSPVYDFLVTMTSIVTYINKLDSALGQVHLDRLTSLSQSAQ